MKNKNNHFPITVRDYLVSGEDFSLKYDAEMEMLITDPQPDAKNLSKYYNSEAYISHTDSKKGLISFLYQIVKKRAIKKKVKLITSLHSDPKSILDIGAGTGAFLNQAKKNKWIVSGIEPNEAARKLAQEKGIVLAESIDSLHGKKFDVITLWHVLEHLPDLKETTSKIENLLKSDGILIIAVPNYKSFDAKYYKAYWAAFDVPRHLWHFSRSSMEKLFSKKMELLKIKAMLFDSFYVSLLSEKNKTGKQNLFKAFFIGLGSNCSAWQTREYSSLIYCFKKQK